MKSKLKFHLKQQGSFISICAGDSLFSLSFFGRGVHVTSLK